MFVAGFPLLAWNENNYIRVYESLAEGAVRSVGVECLYLHAPTGIYRTAEG